MSTVHNEAKKGEIAKVVLMCGDPLRAKVIADEYLKDVKLVNKVRNMFCFTGTYKGKKVSVMGSGMGMPSMGIYSYELFKFYDVDKIIRVGTCGAYSKDAKVGEVILAEGACTDSNYAHQFDLPGTFSAIADFSMLDKANKLAHEMKIKVNIGNVLTSDIFYQDDASSWKKWQRMGVLAVEMETYALYINAARQKKSALTILTISDNLATGEASSSEDRQNNFKKMMELALNVAVSE
jgi:purine-nucleoside phosphorylase